MLNVLQVADIVIFVSYFLIPVEIAYFARKAPSLPGKLHVVVILFILFIMFCGLTHLAMVFTVHNTWAVSLKLITAIISSVTSVAMFWVLNNALLFGQTHRAMQDFRYCSQSIRQSLDEHTILLNTETTLHELFPALGGLALGPLPVHVAQHEPMTNDAIVTDRRAGMMYIRIRPMELYLHLPVTKQTSEQLVWFQEIASQVDIALDQAQTLMDYKNKALQLEEQNAQLSALQTSERQLMERKSQYLAVISHEIRTPLTAVLATSELLTGTALSAEQAESVKVINSAGKTLLDLINNVLDESKLEAGQFTLECLPIHIDDILQELAVVYRALVEAKQLQFVLQLPARRSQSGPQGSLHGDPLRIKQVLHNLLSNAVKFTARGQVRLSASIQFALDADTQPNAPSSAVSPPVAPIPAPASSASHAQAEETKHSQLPLQQPQHVHLAGHVAIVTLQVEDTGCGMSETQMTRLFEPYSQLRADTARRYGGTGLGLSIVDKLVTLMHGRVMVQSKVNVGSLFTVHIKLPISTVDELTVTQSTTARPPLNRLSQLRVLLADDNELNRSTFAKMLKQLGVESVTTASNGQQALDIYEESLGGGANGHSPFNVLLLDDFMPFVKGIDVCRTIRARHPHQCIVIVSANSGERQTYMAAGATDTLEKPFLIDQLRQLLLRL